MNAIHFMEIEYKQTELQKQAEHYRLIKSFKKPSPLRSLLINAIGRLLIQSGQVLINRTQTAY
jgi:hypothetical protein